MKELEKNTLNNIKLSSQEEEFVKVFCEEILKSLQKEFKIEIQNGAD